MQKAEINAYLMICAAGLILGLPALAANVDDSSACNSFSVHGLDQTEDRRAVLLRAIKEKVRLVWGQQKARTNVKQVSVSRAIGVSQGMLSKLLNNDDGHPWTPSTLNLFAEFLGLKMWDMLPEGTLVVDKPTFMYSPDAFFLTYTAFHFYATAVTAFYERSENHIDGKRLELMALLVS